MVGRLHVVLLSIVPTGAALAYLLWVFGWKKPKGINCKKTDLVEVVTCEQGYVNVDSTTVSNGEQLTSSVNNEDDSPAKSHVSSGITSLSDYVSMSRGSSCTDLKSPCADESASATAVVDCKENGELAADIDGASLDHCTADKMATCYSVNVDVTENIADKDDIVKCPVIDSEENSSVVLSKSEECCDSCVTNRTDDDDSQSAADTGYVVNGVLNEGCENGRRNSIGSTSDGNSCDSHDTNANSCVENKNVVAVNDVTTHSFDFPTEMCGRLIGQRGRNVAVVKEKSGAEIFIRGKQYNTAWQIVTLEGTQEQVSKALDLIKRKFPVKRFPGIDYERCLPDVPVLPADVMQLCLPMGVPVEVIVCSVVAPNHVFLQQPTHPTFPSLDRQNYHMRMCYSVENVPHLPRPIDAGVICAAPVMNDWCRAQVVESYPDTDEYDVKLVDYGGYLHHPGTSLRQIRSDFMSVPFQAIECYMASVIPLHDDGDFSPSASKELEDIVKGCILHCEVTAVEEDGVPYVMLTKVSGTEATVVNRELVRRGLARWLEM